MRWQYGITTVPNRVDNLFSKSLTSLCSTGFNSPHIFVDGGEDKTPYLNLGIKKEDITLRYPNVKTFGNWILSLWELFLRNPKAHRYAIFQDDVIYTRNLKEYLETIPLGDDEYWNLFTFMKDNERLLSEENHGGFFPSAQFGRGALALVFSLEVTVILLSTYSIANKPRNVKRGEKRVDGAIATALSPRHNQSQKATEKIHNPSLVQHIGDVSSIGNHNQAKAGTFPGEQFDCLTLLKNQEVSETV